MSLISKLVIYYPNLELNNDIIAVNNSKFNDNTKEAKRKRQEEHSGYH